MLTERDFDMACDRYSRTVRMSPKRAVLAALEANKAAIDLLGLASTPEDVKRWAEAARKWLNNAREVAKDLRDS